jgi:hypothetical protein
MNPDSITIGDAYTFQAEITDESGLKSVSFVITFPSGATQSYSAGSADGVNWSINFSGFSNGDWQWHVVAKDNAGKGGNTTTSTMTPFTVDTSGGGETGDGGSSSGSYAITNEFWPHGGDVQWAAGRIYFEMPSNSRRKRWNGYVCSGTVIRDGNPDNDGTEQDDRSVIITAAHCVYDDANKAFARNVLFIPNQASSGTRTDTNCGNDVIGCWLPDFGVVDVNWTTRTFPVNIPWDYAYYVVSNTGSHFGPDDDPDNPPDPYLLDPDLDLELAAGTLPVSFSTPVHDTDPASSEASLDVDFTYALGYSYSDDPNFMHCAEDLTIESGYGDWWLPSCELSGGSSGGPWVQPMNPTTGTGPIISVNSWGYVGEPGMAGPRLDFPRVVCLRTVAESNWPDSTDHGEAGLVVACQ